MILVLYQGGQSPLTVSARQCVRVLEIRLRHDVPSGSACSIHAAGGTRGGAPLAVTVKRAIEPCT